MHKSKVFNFSSVLDFCTQIKRLVCARFDFSGQKLTRGAIIVSMPEASRYSTRHKHVHIIYLLAPKKSVFFKLWGPAVPPEFFLQPARPPMKNASRHKLYHIAQGGPVRFFLNSKISKKTSYLYYFSFISPSAWSTTLTISCIGFSAKFATKKLKPPKRFDHFWKIQGSHI